MSWFNFLAYKLLDVYDSLIELVPLHQSRLLKLVDLQPGRVDARLDEWLGVVLVDFLRNFKKSLCLTDSDLGNIEILFEVLNLLIEHAYFAF